MYPFRELLVRLAGVKGLWSYYLPASGILAQSGFFEVIEAIVAMIVSPEFGSMYLGTQGMSRMRRKTWRLPSSDLFSPWPHLCPIQTQADQWTPRMMHPQAPFCVSIR